MSCPFCRTDNKVRQDAEHIVCYRCQNSISISKDKSVSTNVLGNHKPFTNYYDGDNTNVSSVYKTKSMRVSDLFFPDPMFYPGYYPVDSYSMSPYGPYHPYNAPPFTNQFNFQNELEEYVQRRQKYELYKHNMRLNRGLNKPLIAHSDPLFNKLKAIKEAIREDNEKYKSNFNNLNNQPSILSANKSGTLNKSNVSNNGNLSAKNDALKKSLFMK